MSEDDSRMVCIVDDDASLRRSLRNLLTSVGFRVETFPSATAFLESVPRQNIGCMVLDLRMEGMSGLQLLRSLGATGSRIPVIILTAHGDVGFLVPGHGRFQWPTGVTALRMSMAASRIAGSEGTAAVTEAAASRAIGAR